MLIVILDKTPKLVFSDDDSIRKLRIHGDKFEDLGHGQDNGFYDFLRLENYGTVGVRYYWEEEARSEFHRMGMRDYIHVARDGRAIEIYWSDERHFTERLSDDQCLGDNYIFESERGVVAVSFDCSETDWESIGRAAAPGLELSRLPGE